MSGQNRGSEWCKLLCWCYQPLQLMQKHRCPTRSESLLNSRQSPTFLDGTCLKAPERIASPLAWGKASHWSVSELVLHSQAFSWVLPKSNTICDPKIRKHQASAIALRLGHRNPWQGKPSMHWWYPPSVFRPLAPLGPWAFQWQTELTELTALAAGPQSASTAPTISRHLPMWNTAQRTSAPHLLAVHQWPHDHHHKPCHSRRSCGCLHRWGPDIADRRPHCNGIPSAAWPAAGPHAGPPGRRGSVNRLHRTCQNTWKISDINQVLFKL